MTSPLKKHVGSLLLVLLSLSLSACAESAKPYKKAISLPANYVAECGSCHTPYPAYGLAAEDWRTLMARLDKHFGDNASLDAATRKTLEDYLTSNAAGTPAKLSPGETARVSKAVWFVRKHHEVPDAYWRDPRIKSAANCGACHPKANEGRYNEHEIRLPNGMRWED